MFHPNTTKSQAVRRPVAKLLHLETFLGGGSSDSFYTGFSGRIEDGGIFLTTYRQVEQYTPVEVTIHFPDGSVISVRGTVEWIRESNAAAPDMAPGIGVTFLDLGVSESAIIEAYLITHPPVFLDSIEIMPPRREAAPVMDDIELESLPVNLGPGCDLDAEQIFVSGLARDITHYLNERPMVQFRKQVEQKKRVFHSSRTLTVRAAPHRSSESFQGGFRLEDGAHRLFVCTETPAPVGTLIPILLLCDSGAQVGCMGEVRWIRKPNPLVNHFAAPAGMGVVLRDLKESTWQAIQPKQTGMLFCELASNGNEFRCH
ncbi:MAG: PilZ domain-containing protein [Deltaproteobacteria bacterium]|nr:PilZ domain-containing protein [Deltaproteobacteria bacterium]MBN2671425.1 PilZ domain-containing protein [Deltaproteobacteria bacterium]